MFRCSQKQASALLRESIGTVYSMSYTNANSPAIADSGATIRNKSITFVPQNLLDTCGEAESGARQFFKVSWRYIEQFQDLFGAAYACVGFHIATVISVSVFGLLNETP